MFCSEVPLGTHTKVLQIVFRSADMPRRSAPNLDRHGSSQMSSAAWLEIPDLRSEFVAACLSGTFKYLFLIILLIRAKRNMLIAAAP